jgi:hypothetical protein
MGYVQQCQNIAVLMREGRNDDAMEQFEHLVSNMQASGQYSTYSDNEVRALAQSQYQSAIGTALVDDINNYASSSLGQGVKEALPITGLFESHKSKQDMTAQVTGTPKALRDDVAKVAGATISVAGTALAAKYGSKGLDALVTAATSSGKLAKFTQKAGKAGKVGLAIAAVTAAIGAGASLFKTFSD